MRPEQRDADRSSKREANEKLMQCTIYVHVE